MKILDKLFFEAGGYTADDLVKASSTERRQILQLGSAVILSIIASMISWSCYVYALINSNPSKLITILSIVITAFVVLFISLSLNRNLIYFSDVRKEEKPDYSSYSPATNKGSHTLVYLRITLVLIVSILNFQQFSNTSGVLIIIMLGLFELYPVFLKRQMGQTILGHRMRERLIYQQKRSQLKGEKYAREIKDSEHKIYAGRSDQPSNDRMFG